MGNRAERAEGRRFRSGWDHGWDRLKVATALAGALVFVSVGALGQGGGASERLYHVRTVQEQASDRFVAQAVPAELSRLVRLATTAANGHDPGAFGMLASPAAVDGFEWVRSKTTPRWAGDLLPLPKGMTKTEKAENEVPFLAVFHAFHTCQSDGDHIHRVEKTADGWRLGAEILETETGGYRVRDHDLTVAVDVPKQTVSVHDTVRLEMATTGARPYCLLRMSEDFQVSAFKVNGTAVPFRQAGGILLFVPPAIKATEKSTEKPDANGATADSKGTEFTLDMNYAGKVSHQGSDYILPQEATINSYWYPNVARLPATATVTTTAPAGWAAVTQGEKRQERRNGDGSTTVTYRNEVPTCWFTLDVGRYTVTRRTVNGRTLSTYLLTDSPDRASKYLDLLAQALAFYDTNFAPFPYTHYDVVETKGPFGGALEGYSMATFGPGTLPGTLPHELAHTWWGGMVPCAYTRSMWNEGMADYAATLFGRMNQKASALLPEDEQAAAPGKRHAFGKEFDGWPLALAHDTSDGPQGAVGYGKGNLVMRVLEEELGRPMLLRCLHSFVTTHPKGEAAEWADFQRVVNQVTGQNYDWFFTEWIDRKGLPALRFAKVTARPKPDGTGFVIEGDILQEGNPYRLHLPLRLQLQDRKVMRETIVVDGNSTHFSLTSRVSPTLLTLDPDNILPLATTTEQGSVELH